MKVYYIYNNESIPWEVHIDWDKHDVAIIDPDMKIDCLINTGFEEDILSSLFKDHHYKPAHELISRFFINHYWSNLSVEEFCSNNYDIITESGLEYLSEQDENKLAIEVLVERCQDIECEIEDIIDLFINVDKIYIGEDVTNKSVNGNTILLVKGNKVTFIGPCIFYFYLEGEFYDNIISYVSNMCVDDEVTTYPIIFGQSYTYFYDDTEFRRIHNCYLLNLDLHDHSTTKNYDSLYSYYYQNECDFEVIPATTIMDNKFD